MATSLRGHLLALLLPVAVAAILGGMLAVYFIASKSSAAALDDGLLDAAQIYAEQLRGHPREVPPELSAHAQRVLLATSEDRIFFTVEDVNGRLLAGDAKLGDDLPWGTLEQPVFFDRNYSGYWLRGISVVFDVDGAVRHMVLATTAQKREELMGDIMLGMMVPQFLLLLVSTVLVWAGVRQGLAPLVSLRAEIGQRTHHDLRPLETETLPEELRPIVAEINELFDRLERAIETQRNFVADAAHQLRTPIAGLLAQLESMDPGSGNPALLRTTARRLARLVGQLLALSRAEPGIKEEDVEFDLAALIREEANAWLPRAFQRNIEMSFDLAATSLHGYPHAVREMLANLIDNAIRYGRHGGHIAVSCTVEADESVLCVDDDGPGIPPEERLRVFERFYRGKTASADGCGLGLPIVAALARQSGAVVRLDSAPELGGLRAEIRLPRKATRE